MNDDYAFESGFWYGGPLVMMRDDSVADPQPHNFDAQIGACINCGRGYYEVAEDGVCDRAPPAKVDYLAITRDMVGAA